MTATPQTQATTSIALIIEDLCRALDIEHNDVIELTITPTQIKATLLARHHGQARGQTTLTLPGPQGEGRNGQ